MRESFVKFDRSNPPAGVSGDGVLTGAAVKVFRAEDAPYKEGNKPFFVDKELCKSISNGVIQPVFVTRKDDEYIGMTYVYTLEQVFANGVGDNNHRLVMKCGALDMEVYLFHSDEEAFAYYDR